MSYGPNYPEYVPANADFVEQILRGTKPGYPGRTADQMRVGLNLATAKALGLTIPKSSLCAPTR